jgi:Putative peptidoglycan binding domain
MSRDLGPSELRVCRIVFACLVVMAFGFLLLSAVESLSNPSPPARQVQAPAVASSTRPNPMLPNQSSSMIKAAQGQAGQGAVLDGPVRVFLLNMKLWSELPDPATLERTVRFDPRPLAQRLGGADALPQPGSTSTFHPQPDGLIVTASFASAGATSMDLPWEMKSLPMSEEQVRRIQSRLRDLGFLSAASTGAWDAGSRDALQDFKVINGLDNDETWDYQTSEKLNSPTAVRAEQSIIGNWCRSAGTNLRLSINSRRARSSAGSVCEFHDLEANSREWRVRSSCSQGGQRWTANGKFTLTADKLVWTSEGDVISHSRCN